MQNPSSPSGKKKIIDYSDLNELRLVRMDSWLKRGKKEYRAEDFDAAFIFFWIAFNAGYSNFKPETMLFDERGRFEDFCTKINRLDSGKVVYNAIWEKFSSIIRHFLDNQFVFQPFWNHQNKVPGYDDWEERFAKSRSLAHKGLAGQDTVLVLSILFDRLYVLRNQIIHGSAKWNGSKNRDQVKDGASILDFLLPQFYDIMKANPNEGWGTPFYKVIT